MFPNARPCEACGTPTRHTCNGCPCCAQWTCGSVVLAQLEADGRELAGMPFLAAHASLDPADLEYTAPPLATA